MHWTDGLCQTAATHFCHTAAVLSEDFYIQKLPFYGNATYYPIHIIHLDSWDQVFVNVKLSFIIL